MHLLVEACKDKESRRGQEVALSLDDCIKGSQRKDLTINLFAMFIFLKCEWLFFICLPMR